MNAGEDVTLFDFTDSNADVSNWIESSDTLVISIYIEYFTVK